MKSVFHRKLYWILPLVLLTLAQLACNYATQLLSGDKPSSCANDYKSVKNGSTRTYNRGGFITVYTISNSAANSFEEDVQTTGPNNYKSAQSFVWTCTAAGLINHGTGELTNEAFSGISIPISIYPGSAWSSKFTASATNYTTDDYTVSGVESVTVPAGTFQAIKVHVHIVSRFDNAIVTVDNDEWWAAGIGPVKILSTVNDPPVISHSQNLLQSYQNP